MTMVMNTCAEDLGTCWYMTVNIYSLNLHSVSFHSFVGIDVFEVYNGQNYFVHNNLTMNIIIWVYICMLSWYDVYLEFLLLCWSQHTLVKATKPIVF